MTSFFGELHDQYPILITLFIIAIVVILTWLVEHIVFTCIRHLGQHGKNTIPSSSIFANIARVCIWMLGAGVALKICFNVDLSGLIAALGVGGIAISLGFKDTLSNLIGGLQVSMGHLVEPDQYIEVLDQRGVVQDVTWRHTSILDYSGRTHLVPNALINTNSLIVLGDTGYVQYPFAVPMDTDMDALTSAIKQSVSDALFDVINPKAPVVIRYQGVNDAGLNCIVQVSVIRARIIPSVALDRIGRTIQPILQRAYNQS
ncbi:MAG: mechanosensitive ion channel family protein [Eggerthellaceae bacterium]|jgi:small-conductance mechanosensitive channel|nr:mechanosensitive ion channel family protein [Eggerthellaceae bacterium]